MNILRAIPVALAFAMFSALATYAQSANTAKPATIWYTEQFTMHSKYAGRDFLIQIAKPVRSAGKEPVVYVLDGNPLFGEIADIAIDDASDGDIAPAYIVGIGYPTEDFNQWLTLRNRDLLHEHVPEELRANAAKVGAGFEGGGGGYQFQAFILKELRPLIERRYEANPHRTILAGHSFGGVFTLHVLLNDPSAFDSYIICSPSIWAEPGLLGNASTFHSAPHRVFIGVGSKEEAQFGENLRMVDNAKALVDRLRDHASNIDLRFEQFEGESHVTTIPECFSDGLQFVLPPAPTAVSR